MQSSLQIIYKQSLLVYLHRNFHWDVSSSSFLDLTSKEASSSSTKVLFVPLLPGGPVRSPGWPGPPGPVGGWDPDGCWPVNIPPMDDAIFPLTTQVLFFACVSVSWKCNVSPPIAQDVQCKSYMPCFISVAWKQTNLKKCHWIWWYCCSCCFFGCKHSYFEFLKAQNFKYFSRLFLSVHICTLKILFVNVNLLMQYV